jgi:hypothetical protein
MNVSGQVQVQVNLHLRKQLPVPADWRYFYAQRNILKSGSHAVYIFIIWVILQSFGYIEFIV